MGFNKCHKGSIIYVHIPKCGGSTLNAILRNNFSEQQRFYVNPNDIASSKEDLASQAIEQCRQIDLLHGHLSYGWHEYLSGSSVYFTFLRDPVERVVSHYNYVRFRVDHTHYLRATVESENMSIADYVRSGVCDEVNNGQVRLLSGVEDIVQAPYGNSKLPYGTNNPTLLDRALHNIAEHFAVVGIQEYFDESLLLLKARLGLQDITYTARNVSRNHYEKLMPTAEEVEVIKTYNRLDIALYESMRKRFKSDFESLGASSIRLKLFQAQNRFSNALRSVRRRLEGPRN